MEKQRWHMSDGVNKKCSTTPDKCRAKGAGGEHFEGTQKEAEKWAEKKNSEDSRGGSFSGAVNKVKAKLSREPKDPSRAHIAAADKKIASMKKDLDARDTRVTVSQQILDEVSDEELGEMMKVKTSQRQAGIGYMKEEDSDRTILGVSYGGDFKAEEEWGLGHISKALKEGTMKPEDVTYEEENGKGILSVRADANDYVYERDKQDSRNTAVDRFDRYVPFDDMKMGWKHERKSVAELRDGLKGKVKPLPTKKDDLIAETVRLEKEARGDKKEIKPPQGEFQRGNVLTIVSDNKAMKAMMRKSKEAHDAGALRTGSSSNPFSRGVMFYDDRDISKETKMKQVRAEEALKSAKENIKGTQDKLKEQGTVYAVSPHVDHDIEDINDAKYWLNFSPDRRKNPGREQMFGYFRKPELEQMAEGDFSPFDKKEEEKKRREEEYQKEKAAEDQK